MYDLREHKELISQLVSEANQNDENWRWSVKSVGKGPHLLGVSGVLQPEGAVLQHRAGEHR